MDGYLRLVYIEMRTLKARGECTREAFALQQTAKRVAHFNFLIKLFALNTSCLLCVSMKNSATHTHTQSNYKIIIELVRMCSEYKMDDN